MLQLCRKSKKTPDLTFELGRLYYAEGTTADSVNYTPEMKKEALLQADSAFAKLAELVPDNYLGKFLARSHQLCT